MDTAFRFGIMAAVKTSIIMPFYKGWRYADLAVRSMVKHCAYEHVLLVGIEPEAEDDDRAWLETVPGLWPGECRLYYHEKNKGAYANTNFLVQAAETDVVTWFTTDQVAGPGWDTELLRWVKPRRFVTGRLVEAGATLIGDRTIWKRFGVTPDTFDQEAFDRFCRSFRPRHELDLPRHFIPLAFYRQDMLDLGGFLEGKETKAIHTARSDLEFFKDAVGKGYELVEAQRALTYHFQSGSKRQGALLVSLLNWIYPYSGMRVLHRLMTGYRPLIDELKAAGALDQLARVRRAENVDA